MICLFLLGSKAFDCQIEQGEIACFFPFALIFPTSEDLHSSDFMLLGVTSSSYDTFHKPSNICFPILRHTTCRVRSQMSFWSARTEDQSARHIDTVLRPVRISLFCFQPTDRERSLSRRSSLRVCVRIYALRDRRTRIAGCPCLFSHIYAFCNVTGPDLLSRQLDELRLSASLLLTPVALLVTVTSVANRGTAHAQSASREQACCVSEFRIPYYVTNYTSHLSYPTACPDAYSIPLKLEDEMLASCFLDAR